MPLLVDPITLRRSRENSKQTEKNVSSLPLPSQIRVVARMRPLLESEQPKERKLRFVPVPPSKQAREAPAVSPLSPDTLSTADTCGSDESASLTDASSKRETSDVMSPAPQPAPQMMFWNQNSIPYYGSDPESPCRKPKKTSALEEQLNNDPSMALETTPLMRNTRKEVERQQEELNEEETYLYESLVHLESIQNEEKESEQDKITLDLDGIYSAGLSQFQVYQHSVRDVVRRNILVGNNSTVMAFGKSGSGKSYTLFGPPSSSGTDSAADENGDSLCEQDGIFSRAVSDLFEAKQHYEDDSLNLNLDLSCCEVFQDCLYDLLLDTDLRKKPPRLHIRDHHPRGPHVHGLQSIPLNSLGQARQLIHQAMVRRHTAGDQCTQSHAIVSIAVRLQQVGAKDAIEAKLILADLAGSDRTSKQDFSDKDLKVLDKIITVLGEKDEITTKSRRGASINVPYRDSKVTRLLRDSLGGNCCTVLVACIAPTNMNGSLDTLQFAQRVRSVSCQILPSVGLPPKSPENLQSENRKLYTRLSRYKRRLRRIKAATGFSVESDGDTTDGEGSKYSLGAASSSSASTTWREQQALSKALRTQVDQAREEAKTARTNSAYLMEHLEDLRKLTSQRSPSSKLPQSKETSGNNGSTGSATNGAATASITLSEAWHEELSGNDISTLSSIDESEQKIALLSARAGCVDEKAFGKIAHQTILEEVEELENYRDELKLEVDRLVFRMSILKSSTALSKVTGANENANRETQLALSYSSLLEGQVQMLRQREEELKRLIQQQVQDEQVKLAEAEERHQREKDNTHAYTTLLEGQIQILREQVSNLQEVKSTGGANKDLEAHNAFLQSEVQKLRLQVLELKSNNNRQQELLVHKYEEQTGGEPEVRTPLPPAHHQRLRTRAEQEDSNEEKVEISPPEEEENKIMDATPSVKEEWDTLQVLNSLSQNSEGSQEYAPFTNGSGSASSDDAIGHRFPLFPTRNSFEMLGEDDNVETGNQPVICNMETLKKSSLCSCESKAFPGNPENVDFYLPKIAFVCSCGNSSKDVNQNKKNPYALKHILRDWQVAFLASVDISRADKLVKVAQKRSSRLARLMHNWRKQQRLPEFQPKSCLVAIHIWSKTCKSILESIREQQKKRALEYCVGASPGQWLEHHPPEKLHSPNSEIDQVSSLDGWSDSSHSTW